MVRVRLPARHHQSGQTLEEADVSFLLEVVQHFLHKEPKQSQHGSSGRRRFPSLKSNHIKCRLMFTCCTRMLPPFRMEMPSWRVTVTMAPRRPDDHSPCMTHCSLQKRPPIHEWSRTFAGTDHLEHHLRSASVVQPGLLIQHLLLLHFLFLQEETGSHSQQLSKLKGRRSGVGGRSFTSNVFSFPSSSTSSSPSAQLWKRTHDEAWVEVADEANTWLAQK